MKSRKATLPAALALLATAEIAGSQELLSVKLSDVIKSQGTGNIDILKDVSPADLEALRVDNDGYLVFAVDINEDASGTEKASSQGVSVKSVRFTASFDDGSQLVLDLADGCCFSETQALLAEAPGDTRQPFYTLLGESGSSRISSSNSIQDAFDSTLKVEVTDTLYDPAGRSVTAAVLQVVLLQTNDSLGDPEAFYDFSAGFEDLALLNARDTAFLDSYGAGREEAPTVILTNPPPVVDPLAIANWNYFPSASSFYVVGYEDLYPAKGDYDFNDLTVAYKVAHGLNADGDLVAIEGTAHLITRGSAYSHDWHLSIDLPAAAAGSLSCAIFTDETNPQLSQACAGIGANHAGGVLDLIVFSDTLNLFPDPAGSLFVNTQRLYSEPWNLMYFFGPRADFRLDMDAPISAELVQQAPYDPYLYVRDTNRVVKLMEVDPAYQDSNGFPFGMLLTSDWKPPLEFTDTATAYPSFNDFVSSEGTSSLQWYNTPLPDFIVDIPGPTVWSW
jgi:LruC domain-containing protein